MKTGDIHQEVFLEINPQEAYELIMDEKIHAEFTGSEVKMSRETDGSFETYDGYCHGYTIALEPGQKIVQAWHFDEEGWPDDHFSICTFIFTAAEGGTRLDFTQTDIPEHKVKALASGWEEFYWQPIKAYLTETKTRHT